MRWPEFQNLVTGLLVADTRLSRHFRPSNDKPPGGDEDAG